MGYPEADLYDYPIDKIELCYQVAVEEDARQSLETLQNLAAIQSLKSGKTDMYEERHRTLLAAAGYQKPKPKPAPEE